MASRANPTSVLPESGAEDTIRTCMFPVTLSIPSQGKEIRPHELNLILNFSLHNYLYEVSKMRK